MAKQQTSKISGVRQRSTRNKPSRLTYKATNARMKNKLRKLEKRVRQHPKDFQAKEALNRLLK